MSSQIRRDILDRWRVLVVDDDPGSLEVARVILSFYGAEVDVANNGEEGLAMAKAFSPRFIISDLSMPVMDGWVMIDKLKRDPSMANIPIIALTAHAMVGDREWALAAGCHNYLAKPLTPATFMQELLSLLVEIPMFSAELSV